VSGELLPPLRQRFTDSNGAPLVGGKLFSYVAGTSVPLATFADESESTPNSNPTILDSRGEASIFISSGIYKFVLKDTDDNVIYTQDNVAKASSGTPGSMFRIGVGAPDNSLGQNGDSYLDLATAKGYTKSAGTYSVTGTLNLGGFSESGPFNFLNSQIATNLTGETADSAVYSSVVYEFQAIRGTTVFVNGRFALQYLNSAWRIVEGEYLGEPHGLTFSLSGTTTAQLRLASDGSGSGSIKFKKILYTI
jgi:hypothetical protein